jgi:hypothetical protein
MAEDIRDNEMQGLVDMTHLESREVELDDGAKGWLTVSEGQNPSEKITLRLSFMTVRGYSSAITLMLFARRIITHVFRKILMPLTSP